MQPGQSLRHHWPGLVIHSRFDGTVAYLVFDDAVNRFRLTVDGARETALILTRPGRAVIELAGLAPGPHDITLEKLNESAAPAGFGGIWAKAAAPEAPADRRPLIEFIGDSETLGYGNTAPGRDCTAEAVFLTTDSTAAFPARVAAALGGQARVIAQSGIGIVRNHQGLSPGITMTDLYPLDEPTAAALPALPEPRRSLLFWRWDRTIFPPRWTRAKAGMAPPIWRRMRRRGCQSWPGPPCSATRGRNCCCWPLPNMVTA